MAVSADTSAALIIDESRGLLGSAAEDRFEPVLRIAASLCDTPMASISFNDRSREHFVACLGCRLVRAASSKGFSEYIVSGSCPLIVEDCRTDTRFRQAPLREKLPDLRFYAGVPIIGADARVLGTLAVMDNTPRHLPAAKLESLQRLAVQLALLLETEHNANTAAAAATDASNEPRFDSIFSTLPGYHYLVDPEAMRFIGVTEAILHALALPREKLLTQTLADVLEAGRNDEESRECVRTLMASIRRVAQTGKPDRGVALPYPLYSPETGELETHYWNVVHAPVHDRSGKVSYVIGHAVNVTELVELREREGKAARDRRALEGQAAKLEKDILRRSKQIERLNEHLHMAQAMANVGSWELDLVGDASFWSDEVYALTGPAGRKGGVDPILDAVHPDDQELLESARQAAIETREQVEVTHRLADGSGSVHHVRQHIRVALQDDGTPARLYGTIQDITREKEVEAELKTRARQQEAVARFGQKALKGEPLATLLDEAVELVTETLDVEYCKVMQLLPNGKAMKLVAGKGWKDGLIGTAVVNIGRNSQAGYTLQQKHSVIVTDLRKDERFNGPPLLRDHGVVSGISVLIDGKHGPWGALGAHTTHVRNFTRDDVNFFESIANIIAEAAWLQALTTEMSQRTARMDALLKISRMALTGCTRRKLQAFTAKQVAIALGVDRVAIAEQVRDGSGMKVVAGEGWPRGIVGRLTVSIGEESHGGYVLAANGPVKVRDIKTEKRFTPAPVLNKEGIRSSVSVAIKGKNGPVGLMGAHSLAPRDFNAEEVEFMRQAGAILEEAQAYAISADD